MRRVGMITEKYAFISQENGHGYISFVRWTRKALICRKNKKMTLK
jgi:hypothetical protein